MKLYLFSPVDFEFREDFRDHIRKQNLKITGVVSFIIAIAALLIRIVALNIPQTNLLPTQQHDELSITNLCTIVSSFAMAVITFVIRKRVNPEQQNRYHFVTVLYAILFICCSMSLTFAAQHNPKNTMTMLLIGVLGITIIFVFTIRQLLLIIAIEGLIFSQFIHLFQVDPVTRAFNHIIFWEIMLCFFVTSRLLYSYHANYFIKIKTIEKKNEEIAAANLLKTEILAIVAHDLRNPISGIKSVTHLMEEYPYSPEQENRYIAWINEACKTADQIIEELLLAAKKTDVNKLQTNYVSLNHWIINVRDNWQQQSKQQQQCSRVELSGRKQERWK